MGLDASFRRFHDDELFCMRNHRGLHDLLLEANRRVGGPGHVDAPIIIHERLLDSLEALIGSEAAPAAQIDPKRSPRSDAEDWEAAQPERLAMTAFLRERIEEGEDHVSRACC